MTGRNNCSLSHQHSHRQNDATRTLIKLTDVSIGWGRRGVLDNICLDVHRGDFIAITGPNGGGKTTLLRIILGLLRPDSGRVHRDVTDMRIGYLPQKNMIDSHFPISVREVISSGLLGIKGIPSDRQKELLDNTVRRVELSDHIDRPIGLLSGGQLQRALLGRAIIADPDLLVLDEPLSYIDKRFENKLYSLIEDLSKDTTIILVSHEMSTIAGMANRHFIVDRTLHECTAHHHFIHSDCDQ